MKEPLKKFLAKLCPGVKMSGPENLIGLIVCISYLGEMTVYEKVQKVIVKESEDGEFKIDIPLIPGQLKTSMHVPLSGSYPMYPPGFVRYSSKENQWKMSDIIFSSEHEMSVGVSFK